MKSNKISENRSSICSAVNSITGISKKEAKNYLEIIIETICTAVQQGNKTTINKFGTFKLQRTTKMVKSEINKKNKEIKKQYISFSSSRTLKEKINGKFNKDKKNRNDGI